MFIEVRHTTAYRYETEARYAIQSLRLTPLPFDGQRIERWEIHAPGLDKAASFIDGFGNRVHLTALCAAHQEVAIEAKGLVEIEDRAGIVRGLPEVAPLRVFLRQTPRTMPCERIRDMAHSCNNGGALDRVHAIMGRVHETISFEIGATHEHTSASEALAAGKGVCQDHAHVLISAARVLGIPARYVNGYFLSGTQGPAEAHHAWAEAWIDELGWVGFDAANLLCPTDQYVRLACGLDAVGAAPIRGLQIGGRNEALDVMVEVQQQGAQQ